MGKDWYWASGSSKSKRAVAEKDCTTTSGCMSAVFQFFDFHHFQFPLNHHHHHASSFKSTNSFLPEDHHTILKGHSGVEAPRNSLELEEPPLAWHSTSLNLKEDENLNIPMGIQIKTRSTSSCSEISSSSPGAKTPNLVARLMGLDLLPNDQSQLPSYSSSSCHETPNLSTKSNLHHHFRCRKQPQNGKLISHRHSVDVDITTAGGGTRSLPESPRISSARRSDVDHHHHRLSLQISKENISVGEELEFSRLSYLRRKELKQDDEYVSPSRYARQMVKQVKESVSRKVGLDITNSLRNRGAEQARERDGEHVCQLKAMKSSRVLNEVVDQSSPGKHSTPSCSPRLSRFLDPKQKIITTSNTSIKDKSSSPPSQAHASKVIQPKPIKILSSKSKLKPVQEQETNQHMINEQRPAKKCKKSSGEKFSSRPKKPPQTTDIIRNKQEEPFVRPSAANRANFPDKKCKQTLLSNDLLNITVPTLLPVKKDPSLATKLTQKQVLSAQGSKLDSQLSRNTSQTYKQEATSTTIAQGNINERPNVATATTSIGTAATPEYEYITRILKRTGIKKDTQVSFTKWFSPSHPLDPLIFHQLENMNPIMMSGQLSHHCNRKLMFELVDEILIDILKPYIKMKPWVRSCSSSSSSESIGRDYGHMQGSALIDMLCKQIRSYPCTDCRVLEDVDGLIDKDLPQMKMQKRIAFEEEGEGVVIEIERDILDTLIHETAVEFGVGEMKR